jgi:hypothetical protein
LVVPVASIYWFHSVLYNGWRQMFFIYPPLVLIGVYGLVSFYQWVKEKTHASAIIQGLMALVLAAGLAEPVAFMVRNHPYENMYFNPLAGDPGTLRHRFELDYWGLSFKQAVDDILVHDPGQSIRVYFTDESGLNYIYTGLSGSQRSRLVVEQNPDQANYFIGDFLFHTRDYFPGRQVFFSANVRGTTICVVYRLR